VLLLTTGHVGSNIFCTPAIHLLKRRLPDVHFDVVASSERGLSAFESNPDIDACYDLARQNGAVGGKLIGAGGGGFLMLYSEDKTRLRRALRDAGLREVRMKFDFEGAALMARS
jgi:D-glycero-alpha-D-manno-heptose-7-phosphate kinase